MAKQSYLARGEVVFSNVATKDTYNGKETNFNLTVALSETEAEKLESMGVKLREYRKDEASAPVIQKKFTSNFPVKVVDLEGQAFVGEIPFGSQVRVAWTAGQNDATYGLKAYLEAVRVVEVNEDAAEELPDEF